MEDTGQHLGPQSLLGAAASPPDATQGWPSPAARSVTQADRNQTGSYLQKTGGCTGPLGWTLVPTQPQLPLPPHVSTPPDTALTEPCVSGTAAGKVFDTQREKGG